MKQILKFFLIYTFLITLVSGKGFAADPPFLKFMNDSWVDSLLENMTLEEKISQLMMITAYPQQNDASKNQVIQSIKELKPGGILVMQGNPVKTASWINEFQANSETPLLIAIDGEWGLKMRIDSTMDYPYAQGIGAIQDTLHVYQLGRYIGLQLKEMGIHINFAPVADINTNPQNPVINFRSFGEDKNNVAEKAYLVAKGMQDVGIIPVAKHFPGHGDTQTDSHETLPVVNHSKERLDSLETYPFRFLSENGISGIMTAHLNVPALDNSGTPASVSKKVVTDYLKNEIGFKGFIVTDAINMKGVRAANRNAEVEALKAGNDMIEFVPDLESAIKSVKRAVEKGELTESEIEAKCRKILALKRWVNLNEYKPAELYELTERLNSPYFEVNNRKLIENSLTVLRNDDILPVQHLDSFKIASLIIGSDTISSFQKMLENYTRMDHFCLPDSATEIELTNLLSKLKNYNLVIAGIQNINLYASGKYGTSEIQREATKQIIAKSNAIFVFFGNAYALKYFENIDRAKGLILAYKNNQLTQELAAQLVFGAFDANGKLPVTVDNRFKVNDGLQVKKNGNLTYSIPEEYGIDSELLQHKIDSIANLGLDSAAFPGCQVLVAKNGSVIFNKCYGYHTYYKNHKVEGNDLYDLASVTKVTGTLPAIMKLVDEKKMSLDKPLSQYWPDFKNSDKQNILVREILAHQARFPAGIPFWRMALTDDNVLNDSIFRNYPTNKFDIRVSENLYMNHNFIKQMYDSIRDTKLLSRKKYVYSDLCFYLFPEIISNITKSTYEDYLNKNFFEPLGAYNISYNPYKKYPLKRIIPTETDDFFRFATIQGFVHDEGAAMLGGVSGHAGLFANANDLAKLFQMYLQKGYYGGKQYISKNTITEFTKIQYPENENRRGLVFDKPYIDNNENELDEAYPAIDASKNSFGHTGFTGTMVWADPDNELLFIFLSNRVYPTRNDQKLYDLNIRIAMHQAIYDCIKYK